MELDLLCNLNRVVSCVCWLNDFQNKKGCNYCDAASPFRSLHGDKHHTLSFAISVGSPDGTNITLSPLLYLYDPLMGQTSHSLLCYICMILWWDRHHTLSFAIPVGSPDGTNITLSPLIYIYLYDPLMGQTSHTLLCCICIIPWWDKHHTLSFAVGHTNSS